MASACHVCRIALPRHDPERAGSQLDTICNDIVNPRTTTRQGTSFRARQAVLRQVHRATRGTSPGWAKGTLPTVRTQYQRALSTYYASDTAQRYGL